MSFASIKSNEIGENHSFSDLSGTVSRSGEVKLNIGLASVETFIDIRNKRIIEHVFKDAATATVTAEIDTPSLRRWKSATQQRWKPQALFRWPALKPSWTHNSSSCA